MDFKIDKLDEKLFTDNTEMDKDVSFSMVVDKTTKAGKIPKKSAPIKINNESSDEDFEDRVEKMISETPRTHLWSSNLELELDGSRMRMLVNVNYVMVFSVCFSDVIIV